MTPALRQLVALLFLSTGCGGALVGPPADDAGRDGASQHDAGPRPDAGDGGPGHTTSDAAADVKQNLDAGPDRSPTVDATPRDARIVEASCSSSFVRDGGGIFPCESARCPEGTVCVQSGGAGPEPVIGRCVGVPASCMGHATCACMAAIASECVFPHFSPDAAGGGCGDLTEGDASFLNFACLACQ
jgi:hypothetical protein